MLPAHPVRAQPPGHGQRLGVVGGSVSIPEQILGGVVLADAFKLALARKKEPLAARPGAVCTIERKRCQL